MRLRVTLVLLLLLVLSAVPLSSAPLTLEQIVAEIDLRTSYTGLEVRSLVLAMGQMYEGEIRSTAEEAVRVAVGPLIKQQAVLEGRARIAWTVAGVSIGIVVIETATLVLLFFLR